MSEADNQLIAKNVRVDRIFPDGLQSNFVSHFVIQHQPDHFILSFFELWPPVIVEDTEEAKREALDKIDSVEARCVARLVVTPTRMQELVELMAGNLRTYIQKVEQIEQSAEEVK